MTTPTPDFEELREEIARIIWGMDQDSVETPFDNLLCGPLLGDLLDTADQILAIPAIADVLRMKPIQTMPVREPSSLP